MRPTLGPSQSWPYWGRIDEYLGQNKKVHAIPFIIQHFLPPDQILNGALQAKGRPEIQLPRPRNAMI
jgi:hypothetical protein